MSVVAGGQTVAVGAEITAAIYDPGNLTARFGARVEVPYTRAIVSSWREATLREGMWWVTLDGVLEAGMFNLVWRTSDPEPPEFEVFIPLAVGAAGAGTGSGLQPAYGVNYPPVDLAEVTPTVDDVAQLERTRTFDEHGNELITFTSETRPTADEVLRIITDSVPVVLATLPSEFDPKHWSECRQVIAMYCAMTVEGSFFKEQTQIRGVPPPWNTEYNAARDGLEETIEEDRRQNNLLGTLEPRTVLT